MGVQGRQVTLTVGRTELLRRQAHGIHVHLLPVHHVARGSMHILLTRMFLHNYKYSHHKVIL